VQIWDASTGAVLYTYRGYNVDQAHANPAKGVLPDIIYTVAWSHNGRRIAAVTQEYCGDDCGVVLTWDALTQGHFSFYPTFPMFALAWSPDDRHFVTSIALGSVTAGGVAAVQITQAS
jgi:WD40 repeat protein